MRSSSATQVWPVIALGATLACSTGPLLQVTVEIGTDIDTAAMPAYDLTVWRGSLGGPRTLKFYACFERTAGAGVCPDGPDAGVRVRRDARGQVLDPLANGARVTHALVPPPGETGAPLIVQVRGLAPGGAVVVTNAAAVLYRTGVQRLALPLARACTGVDCGVPHWVCDPTVGCPAGAPAACRCRSPVRSDAPPGSLDAGPPRCVPECEPGELSCAGNRRAACVLAGGCGRWEIGETCEFPNVAEACEAGVCRIRTCAVGHSDCDGDLANGCEVTGPCLPASCQALPPGSPSGRYRLNTHGVVWNAWCETAADGGGWTLVLKANGDSPTFAYSSPLWTNEETLNVVAANMEPVEAKFPGFFTMPFRALRLVMTDPTDGRQRALVINTGGASLRSVFLGPYRATTAGRAAWYGLLADPSLQLNCNLEGFNIDHGSINRVRLGIVANAENDCGTPDSRIGFGGEQGTEARCGQSLPSLATNTVGNAAFCMAERGDRDTRAFGYLFVR